jgi:uncharacterized SAM-binding protein YcdF (DUF218 family)
VGFLYSVLLTLINPMFLSVALLLVAIGLRRSPRATRLLAAAAVAILLACGNDWLVSAMVRPLEWEYVPSPPPMKVDAIVVLGGGTLPRARPRQTVEVADAGDRVLFAANLFRQGYAPLVIASADVATGGIALRPEADDMSELLEQVGVPRAAIVLERQATNTHEHGVYLCPMFKERQIARALLVTSAMHMRRSLGVFRHDCPSVEMIPAPTDFHLTMEPVVPFYRRIPGVIPVPGTYVRFSAATHEYLGILYYRLRGWL